MCRQTPSIAPTTVAVAKARVVNDVGSPRAFDAMLISPGEASAAWDHLELAACPALLGGSRSSGKFVTSCPGGTGLNLGRGQRQTQ